MSAQIRMARKAGVTLSRTVTMILMMIYIVQSAANVYLLVERSDLQKEIIHRDNRIEELEREVTELRERLKIFQIIEDFQFGFTPQEKDVISDAIYTQSKRLGYDPLLLMALILTESSFHKGQESYMGAQGLMQVKPSTGLWLSKKYKRPWRGERTLFEPRYNIHVGSYYLFELIHKFKDVKKALVAYNIGENALKGKLRLKEKIPQSYVTKIRKHYKMLKEAYPDSMFG
ncbi:MAG: transglycosylase SLT domain-containing protein [candidate division Zixibacteria bacterium]|nr:transglycosylase SLT domain-containing protein [candidate division Zixibacteria bacterium]